MKKLELPLSIVAFVVSSVVFGPGIYGDIMSVVSHRSSGQDPIVCDMPSMQKSVSYQQDPQQQESQETHSYSAGKGCSRQDSGAEPGTELNGVNPQTVGCKCAKKCVNDQTQEDLSRDKDGKFICKNACHKERCTCPDPCKT